MDAIVRTIGDRSILLALVTTALRSDFSLPRTRATRLNEVGLSQPGRTTWHSYLDQPEKSRLMRVLNSGSSTRWATP